MRKNKKVFIGVTNTANVGITYARAFRQHGYETFTLDIEGGVVQSTDRYADMDTRDNIPQNTKNWALHQNWLMQQAWRRAVKECDYFLFSWQSFQWDWSDLKVLKEMGKKVAVVYATSEVQINSVVRQIKESFSLPISLPAPIANCSDEPLHEFRRRLNILRTVEKYADYIKGDFLCCGLGLRGYNLGMVNLPNLACKIHPKRRPVVLHVATKREIKGTAQWEAIVARLKSEGYDFEFQLLVSVPHAQVLKAMEDADIFAYAIGRGGSAIFEAMAGGCVVLSSLVRSKATEVTACDSILKGYDQEKFKQTLLRNHELFQGFPVIHIDENTAYDRLKELLDSYELRNKLATDTVGWVKNNLKQINENYFSDMIAAFEGCPNPGSIQVPLYYRNHYNPGNNKAKIRLLNKYNRYVSDCDWYKEYVAVGSRGDLVF